MSILPYRDIMPKVPESVFIAPGAWVIGDVVIGERSSVWFDTIVRGDMHYIRIGSETNIQDDCLLHVTAPTYYLEIGDRVTVGHKAIVHGCVVGNDCLIGMGSIVLDGVKIGAGSIVAAGSLLTPGFEVPPGSVVMGSPAKIKKRVSPEELELVRHTAAHYVELAADYMNPAPIRDATRIKGFLA